MTRRIHSENGSVERLSTTAMIDVVFLLLIFFMCATQIRVPEGTLRAYLPPTGGDGPGGPPEVRDCRIQLAMSEDGVHIWADEFEVPSLDSHEEFELLRGWATPGGERLFEYLVERREDFAMSGGASAGGLPVVIDFAPTVPTRYVVMVLDLCQRAQIRDIAFAQPEIPID